MSNIDIQSELYEIDKILSFVKVSGEDVFNMSSARTRMRRLYEEITKGVKNDVEQKNF